MINEHDAYEKQRSTSQKRSIGPPFGELIILTNRLMILKTL